ncbi:MAG: class A beta-lactamase-related serine hydrolase [Anaerolineae bacterium]|nr:class A beta-lactamase-related serine hydrolase [Anaerolineae bacterium]
MPAVTNPESNPVAGSEIEAFLRGQMEKRRIPGLQAAVVRHGEIVFLGAYGVANIQDSIPVTDQTVFTINSATKSFTGVAIMQLVEDGKLDLAATVAQYLDDLPEAWHPVTIQQLLIHTSGLPDIMDGNGNIVSNDGDEAAWALTQTLPIEFAPGEKFSYNQTNYLLLGRIIDKLSGQPFTQFIAERQFQAVGMPRTAESGFADSHDVIRQSVRGYSYFRKINGNFRRVDTLRNIFEDFPPFLRTGAGLYSTAQEIARWIIALQQGKLLKPDNLKTLWTSGVLNNGSPAGFGALLNGYALGWPAALRDEHPAVTGIGGGRSGFFVYPQDDLAVVVLTNLQGSSPESFIDEVASYYIPTMKAATGFGLPRNIRMLRSVLMERGFDQAIAAFNEAKQQDPEFHLTEDQVNAWGYKLLQLEQPHDAIEVFKLNVSLYPESGNPYDSLAEGYEAIGEQALAIENYKRSLELNPENTNAVDRLKELEPN